MSEPPPKPWKQPLIATALVILGSIGIFFPAWLPDSPVLPTEDSAVELLQMILLLTASAFWFGAARLAGRVAPYYRVMGFIGLISAVGESDALIEGSTGIHVEYFIVPLALCAFILALRNRKHFGAFFGEFSSHPAAGFFASAFMLIYVLARFLGTSLLWKAALGENYHPDIPDTVEAYLELLACYLLMVGTIGLCLSPRTHDPTAID